MKLLVGFAVCGIAAAQVSISEDAGTATIRNGVISAKVDKTSGRVVSLQFRGRELLAKGMQGVYWEPQLVTADNPVYKLVNDPTANAGKRAEVSVRASYAGRRGAPAVDIDYHYAIAKDDSVLYAWVVLEHKPSYPELRIGEARIALKLAPEIFDFMSIDANRRLQMMTGYDWIHGEPLNVKEARRLTTGVRKGEVDHKYDYSAVLGDTPSYGWSSTKDDVGIWMINPSLEYLNCGPTHPELTAHIDQKDVVEQAVPTLLDMWHGSHYGSRNLLIPAGEAWKKIVGPMVIYANAGGGNDGLWKDSLARAAKEQQAWPYEWVADPEYPLAAQRGAVSGRIVLKDPEAPSAKVSNAWVGLAHAPYGVEDRGWPEPVNWQTDSKNYEYWARSDRDGNFVIRNARPGTYTLYAIADGVLGEYSRADVVVKAGPAVSLGEILWTPVRFGKQLWEIGEPDRTAAEFRHGDHFWQWGLYNLYPQEFPNDVTFIIGKSDWHKDWNYAQPTRPDGKGGYKGTSWSIQFDLPAAIRGTAILRLAIAGARGDRVRVAVNGEDVGDTGRLPDSGVMHRDGIRGYWCERDVRFAASKLKPGVNTIQLKWDGRSWVNGVLYDYLRLEVSPVEELPIVASRN